MATQNLLRLLLLLMLMMKKVLITVGWSEVWSSFRCWCLVVVTNINLGRDSEARFGQDLSCVEMLLFGWDFEVGAWSRFWICLIKICVRICDMTSRNYFGKQNSTLGSVVPLAIFISGTKVGISRNEVQVTSWFGKKREIYFWLFSATIYMKTFW